MKLKPVLNKKPAKNRDRKKFHTCRNCGKRGSGSYCSDCGQSYHDINKPFKEIIWDIFGIFSLDNSVFRTIIPFLIRPGFFTGEYLAGKRKKYMSPVRLYLFMSIVFFFLARIGGENALKTSLTIDKALTSDSAVIVISGDTITGTDIRMGSDSAIEAILADSAFNATTDKDTFWRDAIIRTLKNKSLFYNNLLKNISYALFILMPFFALILQLLYIRRKRYYIEHLIFTLNMHSFALLILSLVKILRLLIGGKDGFIFLLLLAIPVYFTIGMKRFYGQKIFKTLAKETILGVLYGVVLVAVLMGLFLFTLYRM